MQQFLVVQCFLRRLWSDDTRTNEIKPMKTILGYYWIICTTTNKYGPFPPAWCITLAPDHCSYNRGGLQCVLSRQYNDNNNNDNIIATHYSAFCHDVSYMYYYIIICIIILLYNRGGLQCALSRSSGQSFLFSLMKKTFVSASRRKNCLLAS